MRETLDLVPSTAKTGKKINVFILGCVIVSPNYFRTKYSYG
jgi:hypothetical protein